MKRYTIFLLLLLGISCKKGSDSDGTAKLSEKGTLLTQKEWIITALRSKTGSGAWQDIYQSSFDPCDRDDRYVYKKDNTFEYNRGPQICDPTEPYTFGKGVWRFVNNETIVEHTSSSGTVKDYTITQLDQTTLIFSFTAGTTMFEQTYKHP